MDEDVIEERGGWRVRLEVDQDCPDPRDDDDMLEIVGPLLRRWNVRTEGAEFQREFDELDDRGLAGVFPRFMRIFHDTKVMSVYLYDHSSVALSATSFIGRAQHAEWDSGQVGWAYVRPSIGWVDMDHERVISSWVETLGQWMNGETYGYVVEKKEFWSMEYASPERADEEGWDWDWIESCWGYIDYEAAEEAAKEALGAFVQPKMTLNSFGETVRAVGPLPAENEARTIEQIADKFGGLP
jgi:hypothetical protein